LPDPMTVTRCFLVGTGDIFAGVEDRFLLIRSSLRRAMELAVAAVEGTVLVVVAVTEARRDLATAVAGVADGGIEVVYATV